MSKYLKKGENHGQEKLYLVVGTTRVGKSTFVADRAISFLKDSKKLKHPDGTPKLFVTIIDPQGTFPLEESIAPDRIIKKPVNFDTAKSAIALNANPPGLLIIDDARILYCDDRARSLGNLCIAKRHQHLNIVLIYHGLSEVQPVLYKMADKVFLFRTNERYQTFKDKVPYTITQEISETSNALKPFEYIEIDLMQ